MKPKFTSGPPLADLYFKLSCDNCKAKFTVDSDLRQALEWRSENRANPPYPKDNQFWCPVCDHLCEVTTIVNLSNKEDARLVAAAPEMYAALEMVMQAWEDCGKPDYDEIDRVLKKARDEK